MKRNSGKATVFAYLGAILLVTGFYPGLQELLEPYRFLHALWHVVLFIGAACLVYGLETLRTYARRHRRMTS